MNRLINKTVLFTITLFLFTFSANNIAAIIPGDYIVAGDLGDTWTYENIDQTQFTWTLSEVPSGPNAGLFERGDSSSGMVYEYANDVLTIHELNKTPIPAGMLVFKEIEFGQVVTLNDDPTDPSKYLFWGLPSITVQAGTFYDVVALVWLDGKFGANYANTQLGLDLSITDAVTDIEIFARDTGQLAYLGIDAASGLSDGEGFELVSTSIPTPGTLPLLFVGLLSLLLSRRLKQGSFRTAC